MSPGDWTWARRTRGRLGPLDEQRYVLGLARAAVLAALPHRSRGVVGRRTRAVGSSMPADAPPDSSFARVAFAAASEASTPGLLAHCVRAWLWADLLARADGIRHDAELLYAACLLHDLGLTDTHWCRRADCFAVEGAMAAHELALRHGYPAADALAAAVSLHLEVRVPVRRGAEAHLLHAGTTTDLLGVGLPRIAPDARDAVLRRHPRDGAMTDVLGPVRRQAQVRPQSRIAILERRAGFTARVIAARGRFR